MAFALRRDESIDQAASRVAGRQLDKAIDALAGGEVAAAVHGVRKRTKRVRAVARLVRPGIGPNYTTVNRAARDAARELSALRDPQALLATFDALHADLPSVRAGLAARVDDEAPVDVDAAIAHLTRARKAVDELRFDDGADVLAAGLAATYRRARDGFRATLDDRTPEAFHEWRKATKHLWHQTQLLEPAAPSVLHPQAHAFHQLADALGEDHDLAVLVELLADDPAVFGGAEPVATAAHVAEARRSDCEEQARRLGARLYVEKPSAFVARMTGLWQAWLDHGDELHP